MRLASACISGLSLPLRYLLPPSQALLFVCLIGTCIYRQEGPLLGGLFVLALAMSSVFACSSFSNISRFRIRFADCESPYNIPPTPPEKFNCGFHVSASRCHFFTFKFIFCPQQPLAMLLVCIRCSVCFDLSHPVSELPLYILFECLFQKTQAIAAFWDPSRDNRLS